MYSIFFSTILLYHICARIVNAIYFVKMTY